jgi:hypothetical protein
LTKLLKRLSLNAEREGEVLSFFELGWFQKLPSPGKYGKKLLLFILLY